MRLLRKRLTGSLFAAEFGAFLRWLRCFALLHRFEHVRPLSNNAEMIGCTRCQRLYGAYYGNGHAQVLPWDYEMERFHADRAAHPTDRSESDAADD